MSFEIRQLKQKAPFGHPCNDCGTCCLAGPCTLGMAVFERETGPCPALWFDGNDSRCGLLTDPLKFADPRAPGRENPKRLATIARRFNMIGNGCDFRFTGEPDPPAEYARRIKRRERNMKRLYQILLRNLWFWIGGTDSKETSQ